MKWKGQGKKSVLYDRIVAKDRDNGWGEGGKSIEKSGAGEFSSKTKSTILPH